MERRIRVLVGKPGLDGHDRGAKVVAAALRDAGMEVIYTGLHQSAEQIVEAALQEDVDVLALSILSGAHMTLFPEIMKLMRERGIADRLLTGGGIIPPADMETLAGMGVGRLFGPGASTQDIAEYIRSWFVEHHGAEALAALKTRPAAAATHAVSRPGARRESRAKAAVPRGRAALAPRTRKPAAKRAKPKPRARAKAGPKRAVARSRRAAATGRKR